MQTLKNEEQVGYWLRRYLRHYLPVVQNTSINTIHSYRDTYRQLLQFVAMRLKKDIDELEVLDISYDIVIEYLYDVEHERNCKIQTRNQRLLAIHTLAKYIGSQAPEYVEWCGKIRSIPTKKHELSQITYLEKQEMDALLGLPNQSTEQGWRDYTILLFLYNTGVRVDELINLKVKDLYLSENKNEISLVKIIGKGKKERKTPLWNATVKILERLINGRNEDDNVFLSRLNKPISRFGVYEMVRRYGKKLEQLLPSVKSKRISPHTIRHTTATHLLQAGVDINTIRAWLGHVSVDTTNIYAEVNIEMKANALKTCEIHPKKSKGKQWKKDDIMSFLKEL